MTIEQAILGKQRLGENKFTSMNKKILIVVILFFTLISGGCVHMPKENKKAVTLNESIAIAKKVANELGYIITELEVVADSQNSLWNKHKINILTGNIDLKKKLENEEYWVIYFRPKDINRVGGDLFVFIDKKTGTVIGYLRGQ